MTPLLLLVGRNEPFSTVLGILLGFSIVVYLAILDFHEFNERDHDS